MITSKEKTGQQPANKNNQNNPGPGKMPAENPGQRTPNKEIIYPHESEANPQREGADATYTERNDVTPPNKKEFPSVGPAKTDFESRAQGRTTGRMIGHEPGTEGI
jgi:hypothetical protein